MNALEKLFKKPRGERTVIENCIVDAALLEEAERDGETERMEEAAEALKLTITALEKAKSIFRAASMGSDLRLAEKHIDAALKFLEGK